MVAATDLRSSADIMMHLLENGNEFEFHLHWCSQAWRANGTKLDHRMGPESIKKMKPQSVIRTWKTRIEIRVH